ncbi:MAG: hypothetical protein EBY29_14350 [Planctomycetes bacterium]|nr:hypothetical protein [Planctomycetota bacterium]
MQIKLFSNSAQKFKALQGLAIAIQGGTQHSAMQALKGLQASPMFTGKGWQDNFAKLEHTFKTLDPNYSVFSLNGNSKLPFVSFSSLPGVTCPGAGECLDFCYSFRAWRYKALHVVDASFKGLQYDVRLYVDGDFSCDNDVKFWFDLIKTVPNARVYGYSKSFNQIMSYTGDLPSNYVLNISGGHNAHPTMITAVKTLSITRGEFITVRIGSKVRSSDHGKPETVKALRQAFTGKAFPCPGTCGTCTGKGHACGMQALKGLPIIIAMH